MTKWLICFLAAAFSLIVSPARAECVTMLEARLDPDCVVMEYGAQRGVWFRLDKAEQLRSAWVLLPELQNQTTLFQETLGLREEQVEDLRGSIAARKDVELALKRNNELLVGQKLEAERARDKALKRSMAWHRSPALWFGIGVATTVGAGVAAAILLK